MTRTSILLLALAITTAAPLSAQVVINEVSASNISFNADNFGQYEDWIELYNTTGAPVDISGWYLGDSQTNPMTGRIPAGTIIGANARMLCQAQSF